MSLLLILEFPPALSKNISNDGTSTFTWNALQYTGRRSHIHHPTQTESALPFLICSISSRISERERLND